MTQTIPLHVLAARRYMFKKLMASTERDYYFLPSNEQIARVKVMLNWWCQLYGY